MTSKEIQKMRTQMTQLKGLKSQRKALRDVAKVGGDKAALEMGVLKLEEWFEKYYPALDIHSDKAINAALREAKNALKVAQTPMDDAHRARKGRKSLIDTSSVSADETMPIENSGNHARRDATTVRRAPARVFANKA